ncbi:hypothetical protein TNCV_3061711 [Trichonephila clavipes]|nr:hypothetical protein TNCV_3061711 [Trichonephila clavipes]
MLHGESTVFVLVLPLFHGTYQVHLISRITVDHTRLPRSRVRLPGSFNATNVAYLFHHEEDDKCLASSSKLPCQWEDFERPIGAHQFSTQRVFSDIKTRIHDKPETFSWP